MDTSLNKLKLWMKVAVFGAVAVMALLFVALNFSAKIEPELNLLFVSYDRPRLLLVLLLTTVFSIFGWWMFWLVLKTMRQLKETTTRSRTAQLERDVADMKSKAAMLQTRPGPDAPGGGRAGL